MNGGCAMTLGFLEKLSRGTKKSHLGKALALVIMAIPLFAVPKVTFAQTDEIQVYDAEIEDQGKFNLMIHSNFTPIGRTTPVFPDGIIPNHSFNGTSEWAY